jgi:hypothetical protein
MDSTIKRLHDDDTFTDLPFLWRFMNCNGEADLSIDKGYVSCRYSCYSNSCSFNVSLTQDIRTGLINMLTDARNIHETGSI